MKGPMTTPDEVQTVTFRVTPRQKEKLKKAADALGVARRQKKYTKDIPPVNVRVTREQRDNLEREAAKKEISIGEVVRRRCFPEEK